MLSVLGKIPQEKNTGKKAPPGKMRPRKILLRKIALWKFAPILVSEDFVNQENSPSFPFYIHPGLKLHQSLELEIKRRSKMRKTN